VEGITYERHGEGFFCALAAPAEGEDADFVSKFTVSVYQVLAQVDVTYTAE
jgi:hypothetical protein